MTIIITTKKSQLFITKKTEKTCSLASRHHLTPIVTKLFYKLVKNYNFRANISWETELLPLILLLCYVHGTHYKSESSRGWQNTFCYEQPICLWVLLLNSCHENSNLHKAGTALRNNETSGWFSLVGAWGQHFEFNSVLWHCGYASGTCAINTQKALFQNKWKKTNGTSKTWFTQKLATKCHFTTLTANFLTSPMSS